MVSGVDENLVIIYFMWPNVLQVFLSVHNLRGSTSLRGVHKQVLVTLISVNLMLGGGRD